MLGTAVPPLSVAGLVLAGGLGRRMGGVDKGLQIYAGKPLIAQVLERFTPQVGALWINANRSISEYARFGYPVLGDRIGGFVGPLAGLHAGLSALGQDWLATVPCDAPSLPLDLVDRLIEASKHSSAPVFVAATARGLQPVFLLAHRRALPGLEQFIAAGGRRVEVWLQEAGSEAVPFADESAFLNINTLAEAESGRSRSE